MTKPAKTRDKMSQKDRDAADAWFVDTKNSCKEGVKVLKRRIDKLPSGEQKTILEGEHIRLRATVTMLERREEAFVADNSNQAMRPPSDEDIAETKRLATGMAKAIADQKKSEAIVGFIDSLAALASKVSSLSEKTT